MELVRDTERRRHGRPSISLSQKSTGLFYISDDNCEDVGAHFKEFGAGDQTSDFTVYLTWTDIEEAVALYAKIGNPNAKRLVRARKLAAAVDEFLSGTSNQSD